MPWWSWALIGFGVFLAVLVLAFAAKKWFKKNTSGYVEQKMDYDSHQPIGFGRYEA